MAICELLKPGTRKKVVWLGIDPPEDGRRAFEDRAFFVSTCTEDELRDHQFRAGLAAVVVSQNPEKPTRIATQISEFVKALLDYDCRVILRPAVRISDGEKFSFAGMITDAIESAKLHTAGLPENEARKLGDWFAKGNGEPPLPHAHYYDLEVPWPMIANFVAAHPAGPAPNTGLKILPATLQLNESTKLLFQRAFSNCKEVFLEPIDDGNSGISVYRAFADLASGHLVSWPQPYFVKIGERKKIFIEYQNYVTVVDPYIPFHLGPHLIHERCALGADEGIIVGDFVDESESLLDCARDNRASSAIACLFNRTLSGWYRGATVETASVSALIRLPTFKDQKFSTRLKHAQELGSTKSPTELLNGLVKIDLGSTVLVGPAHGDLHAKNIRVRATDAIVIDFFAHRKLPLVYDAACLEVSLLIDGFAEDLKGSDIEITPGELLNALLEVYDHDLFADHPTPPHPKDSISWFYTCARQIRLYARRMQRHDGQYAAALAAAFLKKASRDPQATGAPASWRAASYLLAERIILANLPASQ